MTEIALPEGVASIFVSHDGVVVNVFGRTRDYGHQITGHGATFAEAHTNALARKAAEDRKHEAGMAWQRAA